MEENSTSNIITSLDTISNDMFIDFSQISNYEQVSEKEKLITRITKNINVIKNLYENKVLYDNTIISNILISLKTMRIIDNKNNSLSDYKKIRKALGHIIYDIYRYSDYHALMSNIPSLSILSTQYNLDDIDDTEPVNSEVIYATIENYIGINTVDNIFQVSENNYLVKLKYINDVKNLCNLLNKMQIGNNIIKVESLNPIPDIVEPVVIVADIVEPVVIVADIVESVVEPDIIEPDIIEPDIIEPDNLCVSNIITSNIITSTIVLDNDDENIIHISIDNSQNDNKELQTSNSSLVSNISYGIFSKISNVFSFFRRS